MTSILGLMQYWVLGAGACHITPLADLWCHAVPLGDTHSVSHPLLLLWHMLAIQEGSVCVVEYEGWERGRSYKGGGGGGHASRRDIGHKALARRARRASFFTRAPPVTF